MPLMLLIVKQTDIWVLQYCSIKLDTSMMILKKKSMLFNDCNSKKN